MGPHPGADACKNTLGGIAPRVFLPLPKWSRKGYVKKNIRKKIKKN